MNVVGAAIARGKVISSSVQRGAKMAKLKIDAPAEADRSFKVQLGATS